MQIWSYVHIPLLFCFASSTVVQCMETSSDELQQNKDLTKSVIMLGSKYKDAHYTCLKEKELISKTPIIRGMGAIWSVKTQALSLVNSLSSGTLSLQDKGMSTLELLKNGYLTYENGSHQRLLDAALSEFSEKNQLEHMRDLIYHWYHKHYNSIVPSLEPAKQAHKVLQDDQVMTLHTFNKKTKKDMLNALKEINILTEGLKDTFTMYCSNIRNVLSNLDVQQTDLMEVTLQRYHKNKESLLWLHIISGKLMLREDEECSDLEDMVEDNQNTTYIKNPNTIEQNYSSDVILEKTSMNSFTITIKAIIDQRLAMIKHIEDCFDALQQLGN